jgi:hypothetical protein
MTQSTSKRTLPPAFDPEGITQGLEKLGELIAKVR